MADYIERRAAIDKLKKWSDGYRYIELPTEYAINQFKAIPSADVEPVVRCKDCAYRNGDYCHNYDGFAHLHNFFVQMDDYCSRGERMDGEQDG